MIGQLIYGIQFHYSWGLPLVVILSLASVVGIGVYIGFWSPILDFPKSSSVRIVLTKPSMFNVVTKFTIMEGKSNCEENTLNIFDQSQGFEIKWERTIYKGVDSGCLFIMPPAM